MDATDEVGEAVLSKNKPRLQTTRINELTASKPQSTHLTTIRTPKNSP